MTTNTFRSHKMPPRSPWRFCGLIVAALIPLAPAARAQISVTNSTPGNSTWTCPANVYTVQVGAYGGGGASGNAGAPDYECTGGGAGGSYVGYSVNVTPGTVYNLTVGAGGVTNSTAGGNGNPGGSSYFGNTSAGSTNGALVCAVGGAGGNGTTLVGSSASRIGGILGGIATTNGNIPLTSSQANFADYAGTSGGTSVGGASGVAHSGAGGAGAGPSGSAGGGAGGPALTSGSSSQAGSPGTAPGGGASGAANVTLDKPGGNGGAGRLVLTYLVNTNVAGSSTVVASPTTVPADGATTSTITVTLQDSGSNALSGKTITLASSRGATDTISPASATTSSSGIATFTITSFVGGSAILTATDTTDSIIISQTATVSFNSSVSIDHFTVTPSVSSTNAGQVFTATVQAYATAGSGSPIINNSADGITVLLSSSGAAQFDANGDGIYGDNTKALTNGTFTINVKDSKAESITLTATSGTATGTSSSLNITAGTFTQLQVLLPGESAAPGTLLGKSGTAATETSGIGFAIIVNAVDTNWNVVSSSDTVHITAVNAPLAVLPANTALSGGTVTLNVTNLVAGSLRALTASDVSNTSISNNTSSSYTVVPGAAAQLLVLAPGETAAFGSAPGKTGSPTTQNSTIGYTVTVDALDVGYNLVTNCTDTVHISSSAGGDTLPANAALVGGSKTFSVTNNTVGTTTLTASDASVGGVTNGSSTIPVNINSTTAALASSANPAYEGQSIKLTATISGAGLKTGTVTFKNGGVAIGTSTLSTNVATYNLTGGAGTYSLTATYNGDGNNSASTSSTLSQVVQTGEVVVNPAQMQEGFDYVATNLSYTSTTSNSPVLVTNFGGWYIVSDVASNSDVSSHVLLEANDLAGATTPDIKPLPNQTTNVAEHLEISKGATDREFFRSIGGGISSGSAYFSFLLALAGGSAHRDQ